MRELENILERAFALADDDGIRAADLRLPDLHRPATANATLVTPIGLDPSKIDPRESATSALPASSRSRAQDHRTGAGRQPLQQNPHRRPTEDTFRALRYKLKKLGID